MHIPLASTLAPWLIPWLATSPADPSSSPGSTLIFSPIHAHAHVFGNGSRPISLIHHASSSSAYVDSVALSSLSSDPSGSDSSDLPSHPLAVRTVRRTLRRPRVRPPSIVSWALSARRNRMAAMSKSDGDIWLAPDYLDAHGDWEDVEVLAPDVTDRQTLITLAKMSSNAYVLPDKSDEWWPVGDYNATIPFGWDKDADGLRGHVFADSKNETVIIAVKGTSAGVFGVGGPTAKNDKFNDNLLFSCCCARVDFSWSTVCDCYSGGYKCDQTCLEDALVSESVYATVGTNLYNNVTYMYPNSNIWLVGHSLGGSVSSLIGLSFGAPVVTFEAPAEKLAAQRLHLPLPPGLPADKSAITHVYHTADPIAMGICNGGYSGCYVAGFAMESKCHTGQTILYDTVTVKGWSVDIRTHPISEVIKKVLMDPWPTLGGLKTEAEANSRSGWRLGWGRKGPGKGGDKPDDDSSEKQKHCCVPKAAAEDPCQDCFKWEFGDYKNKTDKSNLLAP